MTTIQHVLEFAQSKNPVGFFTSRDIATQFRVSKGTVAALLANLTRQGRVQAANPAKTKDGVSRWILTEKRDAQQSFPEVSVLHNEVPIAKIQVPKTATQQDWEKFFQHSSTSSSRTTDQTTLETTLKKVYLTLGIRRGDEVLQELRRDFGV